MDEMLDIGAYSVAAKAAAAGIRPRERGCPFGKLPRADRIAPLSHCASPIGNGVLPTNAGASRKRKKSRFCRE
jgi:hypothetical protein